MDKVQMRRLLRKGAAAWNAYRFKHGDWKPDLSDENLETIDFVPPDAAPFDLSEANLCGAKLPSPDRLNEDGRQVVLDGAIFDFSTTFAAAPVDLTSLGAAFVVEDDHGPVPVGRLRVFLSYARADDSRIRPIEHLLKQQMDVRIDRSAFVPGQQVDREIAREVGQAHAVLVFWSSHALASQWVAHERKLAAALEQQGRGTGEAGPRLIYVLLDETPPPVSDPHRIAISTASARPQDVCADIARSILHRPRPALPDPIDTPPPPIAIPDTQAKQLRRRIINCMRVIRYRMPQPDVKADEPKDFEDWPDNANGISTKRFIVYLRSSGCRWAISTKGEGVTLLPGCLDCEHSLAGSTFGRPITSQQYVRQFQRAIANVDFHAHPVLCVYNEGNFFNEAELPPQARAAILKRIASIPQVRSVIVESLPEYIDTAKLAEMRDVLGPRTIEIGIGLESSNQTVRALCVNKSYTLDDFSRAIAMIKPHAQVLAYVLVKPSFLSEREALHDALETCRYAVAAGVDVVSVEPINTSAYNMSGELAKIGAYRACWLWTVVEIVRQVSSLGRIRIGGEQFAPKYPHHPFNCAKCSPGFYHAFQRFNATLDVKHLTDLVCECNEEWRAELGRDLPPLGDRIRHALDRLETDGGVNPKPLPPNHE